MEAGSRHAPNRVHGFSQKNATSNAGFDRDRLKQYGGVANWDDMKKPQVDVLIGFSEKKPWAVVPTRRTYSFLPLFRKNLTDVDSTLTREGEQMLTICDRGYSSNCQGYSRREFLRVGSLAAGLAGFSLPALLASQARANSGTPSAPKSVVLLFLQGGPTQHETWDPKPEAPVQYRTLGDTIPTGISGVSFRRLQP